MKDSDGYYRTDANNFKLVCEGLKMRTEGESLDKIATWMNDNGYCRITKQKQSKVYMTTQILSELCRDPFYYGVMIQADDKIVLKDVDPDFQPAITEAQYYQIQNLTNRGKKPYQRLHRELFLPFREMVRCNICSNAMTPSRNKGEHGQYYLYFRCTTKGCTRKKKSIRAKIIIQFLYDFFEKKIKFKEYDYQRYMQHMLELKDKNKEDTLIRIHSLEGSIKSVDREMTELSLGLAKSQSEKSDQK